MIQRFLQRVIIFKSGARIELSLNLFWKQVAEHPTKSAYANLSIFLKCKYGRKKVSLFLYRVEFAKSYYDFTMAKKVIYFAFHSKKKIIYKNMLIMLKLYIYIYVKFGDIWD